MAAGSGAGSLITTKGECSQAFMCAILDHFSNNRKVIVNGQFTKGKDGVLGEGKNISYKLFVENIEKAVGKNGWKQSKNTIKSKMLKVTKISLPQIEKFLETNQDWFMSSVNIANGLSVKLKTKLPRWNFSTSDFIYYRQEGSKNVLMDNIQSIFAIVNKANDRYFGTNINRWCPADIYVGNESGEREVKKLLEHLKQIEKKSNTNTSYNKVVVMNREVDLTFDSLNYIFRAFVDEGLILPVSLKKYSSTNFDIAPVKLFNSGPPIQGTDKKQLKGDTVKITFDNKYLSFGLENSNFYSSMDVYLIASKSSAEAIGFKSLKVQIRDKGSSSSNIIDPKRPNTGWKFGIQAITKFEPSEAQAGGIGGGNLAKISGVALPTQEDKRIVTNIASKFEWDEDKDNFVVKDVTIEESRFINKFRNLQNSVKSKSSVSFKGDIPTSSKSASDKIIFYLDKLTAENSGLSDIKKKKINYGDRCKVAQWFLSKYYCLEFVEKMSVKNKKNIKVLQQIFLVSLSMDPKGPSGKKGGGSTFYAKAGQ